MTAQTEGLDHDLQLRIWSQHGFQPLTCPPRQQACREYDEVLGGWSGFSLLLWAWRYKSHACRLLLKDCLLPVTNR